MNFANSNTLTSTGNTAGSFGTSRKATHITSEGSSHSESVPRKMNKHRVNGTSSGSTSSASSGRKVSQSSSRGKNRGKNNRKQRRLSNNSNGSNERDHKRQKLEPMDLEPAFPKLNQSDPAHARRIQQRRKNIAMGKNTEGYFQYTKQVPKNQRKKRSMETPATPDHTLDIPTKRWQGMVKAWRKALHQYDPPELAAANQNANDSEKKDSTLKINADDNLQTRQIKDALNKGLLVDVTTPTKASAVEEDSGSPFSILSAGSAYQNIMEVDDGDIDIDGGDDSDDDLL